jgi:hypothetical protein
MNEPPQTSKRIVSKAEYANIQLKCAGAQLAGCCLLVTAAFCGLAVLGLINGLAGRGQYPHKGDQHSVLFLIGGILIAGIGTRVLIRMSNAVLDRVDQMNNVIPLTRANTADLPASESLVRASAEPIQQQEAVLLRAATQGVETPSEQLLRPAE